MNTTEFPFFFIINSKATFFGLLIFMQQHKSIIIASIAMFLNRADKFYSFY